MDSIHFLVLFVLMTSTCVLCDTPANCSYGEIIGNWTFQVGKSGFDNSVNCSSFTPVDTYNVTLNMYDVATDAKNHSGFWTLIYNQGFEVVVNQKKWFAFSNYTTVGNVTTSHCSSTLNGWVHDEDGTNWACFYGTHASAENTISSSSSSTKMLSKEELDRPYVQVGEEDLKKYLKEQSSTSPSTSSTWKHTYYPQFESLTVRDMIRRAGGELSLKGSAQLDNMRGLRRGQEANRAQLNMTSLFPNKFKPAENNNNGSLPDHFDWRNVSSNVNGTGPFYNFVSPVRDQQSCGSCYAFGTTAMLEARIRIYTNNELKTIYSPQAIVSCSQYSQGCAGGFPYLIGKYGEDFSILEDSCYPYEGVDSSCKPQCNKFIKTTDYRYLGGFYGAGNETNMMREIYENGPIAVSFEVYNDFIGYKGGVYTHDPSLELALKSYNPWKITNHVVCIVGWGFDSSSGLKYWIVKNSWGTEWGLDGYFWIKRGTDESSIESMPVSLIPSFH